MDIQLILKDLFKLGITTLTQESVKHYVNAKIKPIFENWGKDESRLIELEECLSEYLLRCYAKNNIMVTIVFGRLQKTLDDLYIPLSLEEYRNEDKKWIIDETCYDILDQYNRILIIDKAGMGKSTIVKYFACQGINLDKCIPIVIELRKLDKEHSILEFIKKQLSSYDKNIEIDEIVNMLNKGEFVIFFDGYDEITNENKPGIIDGIQEFVSNARNTKIVITSREEEDLNALGEFKCVNIKPLEKEEAYALIKKYDNNGEISEKLIKKLEEDSSMEVLHEFLSNPLLVSLLYRTFEYKEEIPYKKIDFYNQVYEALFNAHDKTKGSAFVHEKKTKLDKYQFELILRAFGFLSLKSDKVEYSSQMIYQLLEQSIKRFGWLKISASDFLYDITHAVPFIQKDGNEYKWVHKSFMEYFASCFICYDNKDAEQKNLESMLYTKFNEKYYNVLDFCYELDTLGFRKFEILPFITYFVNSYNKYFENDFFKGYDIDYLNKAKQLMILNESLWFAVITGSLESALKNVTKNYYFRAVFCELEESSKLINSYSVKYKLICNILKNKMPDLFETINVYRDIRPETIENFQLNQHYFLNDDVSNPLNSKSDTFYDTVDGFFRAIFSYPYSLLNYKKCKSLMDEIKAEDKNSNSSTFEL